MADGPIDMWAPWPHFCEHLLPIWQALPLEARGEFAVPHELVSYVAERGVMPSTDCPTHGGVMVMARGRDLKRDRHDVRVLLEHGVGQVYSGAHNDSYSDGDRPWIDLHLVPSVKVAGMVGGRAVVVGCPKLDGWQRRPMWRPNDIQVVGRPPTLPVVAFTWHWDGSGVAPEAGTAFYEYQNAVATIAAEADRGYSIIGHAHPRLQDEAFPWYERLGIPIARTLDAVFANADCLVADNTSALLEFASLDRPVVVVNASTYRRDVEHGMRFWEWADIGFQANRPNDLHSVILDTLIHDGQAPRRREIVAEAYTYRDGHCAERAARAILEHIGAKAA